MQAVGETVTGGGPDTGLPRPRARGKYPNLPRRVVTKTTCRTAELHLTTSCSSDSDARTRIRAASPLSQSNDEVYQRRRSGRQLGGREHPHVQEGAVGTQRAHQHMPPGSARCWVATGGRQLDAGLRHGGPVVVASRVERRQRRRRFGLEPEAGPGHHGPCPSER
eukprot:1440247-Prymnesium_polylepis.1